MTDHKIKVGIVGISFGMEFIPIYLRHPDVYSVAVADTNDDLIKLANEKFGIADRDCYNNFEELLKDETIDAIHITTPPATHADFSIRALMAGKHCGCTIPMGIRRCHSGKKRKQNTVYVYGNNRIRKRVFLRERSYK